ncbi:WbqC family protein [Acidovorax sp.]|uniref:WbqC family protein n=1 Tax=Acidovorax sp. TaxID=1872122 RepID=UPI003918F9DC
MTKKVAIMQPYLFPYLGYFQLLGMVDEYVVYDDVHFIQRGWIARNNILLGGQRRRFSISLSQASQNRLINEIVIADDFRKFLKTVEQAYRRAPHFSRVIPLLKRICDFPDRNLARFATHALEQIAADLGIDTRIVVSSHLAKDNTLRAQEKILSICKTLEADVYVNAEGGQALYDREAFRSHGIELRFLHSDAEDYLQFGEPFVPHLSIIDVMMFNEVGAIRKLLENYRLV